MRSWEIFCSTFQLSSRRKSRNAEFYFLFSHHISKNLIKLQKENREEIFFLRNNKMFKKFFLLLSWSRYVDGSRSDIGSRRESVAAGRSITWKHVAARSSVVDKVLLQLSMAFNFSQAMLSVCDRTVSQCPRKYDWEASQ